MRSPKPAAIKPLTVRASEVGPLIGAGKTKVYELLAKGELKSVRLGRSRLVLMESIEALIASREED